MGGADRSQAEREAEPARKRVLAERARPSSPLAPLLKAGYLPFFGAAFFGFAFFGAAFFGAAFFGAAFFGAAFFAAAFFGAAFFGMCLLPRR